MVGRCAVWWLSHRHHVYVSIYIHLCMYLCMKVYVYSQIWYNLFTYIYIIHWDSRRIHWKEMKRTETINQEIAATGSELDYNSARISHWTERGKWQKLKHPIIQLVDDRVILPLFHTCGSLYLFILYLCSSKLFKSYIPAAVPVPICGFVWKLATPIYWLVIIVLTSSTAQGGGGSFKNRRPRGEVGCCESRMAERIHWWTERWLELCFLEWLQWLEWSPHHNRWM